ncbi:MAG: hypothetical protein N4A31_06675 [Rickettsiales bacterium]|jgi:Mn-dependent DtxR family transcriptional regulator|nr:hypothetical protein [Rickettsiales bacterium]
MSINLEPYLIITIIEDHSLPRGRARSHAVSFDTEEDIAAFLNNSPTSNNSTEEESNAEELPTTNTEDGNLWLNWEYDASS